VKTTDAPVAGLAPNVTVAFMGTVEPPVYAASVWPPAETPIASVGAESTVNVDDADATLGPPLVDAFTP
jgi:hypothetical protein